jgi:hypothetical protein
MGGHDHAIKQAQSCDLHAARFSNAVEDGGDFFSPHLAVAKDHPKSEGRDRVQVRNQFVDRCGGSREHRIKRAKAGLGGKRKQAWELITGVN